MYGRIFSEYGSSLPESKFVMQQEHL